MQINNSNSMIVGLNTGLNIDSATTSVQTGNERQPTQQRLNQAVDSYTRSARSSQVIEAEFVESYTARTQAVAKPTTTSDSMTLNSGTETDNQPTSQALSSYNQPINDGPLPGSVLNIFA